jgi:outer membrane receptor protein involved in Fe transport
VDLNKSTSAYGETHKVNLSYKLDPDKLIYFTYSTGFRPGGVNRRTGPGIGAYAADTLDNYEVGWKTSWLDHRLRFNGAIYDEEWNNFQFSFLGFNSFTIIQNAPAARILGAESNIEWLAADHLTISANVAYNHAALTKNFCVDQNNTGAVLPSCPDSTAVAVHGQELPYTPPWKGSVTARYTFEAMGWDAHLQGTIAFQTTSQAGLRTNVAYPPDFTDPAMNANEVALLGALPGYATVDLSVGAERGKTSLELFIKNAFNERGQQNRYTPCTIEVCANPTVADPHVYVIPIQPLTVGIRLGEKF